MSTQNLAFGVILVLGAIGAGIVLAPLVALLFLVVKALFSLV